MEESTLNKTLRFAERKLRTTTRKLMNKDTTIVSFRDNRSEVVSFGVPCHLLNLLKMSQNQAESLGPLRFIRFVP